MTQFMIEDDIARQVEALAAQEQRPVNDVLRAMLAQYTSAEINDNAALTEEPPKKNWMQEMARMAREDTSGVFDGFSPDLSEHSREILETEFADYLLKRMRGQDDEA